MYIFEDEGLWYVHVDGGAYEGVPVEDENAGPLVWPPMTVLHWQESELRDDGVLVTEYTRLQAADDVLTVRSARFSAVKTEDSYAYETVMRSPEDDDVYINPEPPENAAVERHDPDGWLVL